MRSDIMSARDTVLLETENLYVWIRRPDPNHTNWWIAYWSSDSAQVRAWDVAIETVCKARKMRPFHQGCWPNRGHDCGSMNHYLCTHTVQAWELVMGCSDLALAFPEEPLDSLRECGDPALERVYEAFEPIRVKALQCYKDYS